MAKRKNNIISSAPAFNIIKRDAPNHRTLFHSALHYAQYEMTDKQLKSKLIAYAKSQKLDHNLLNVLTDKELACAGKYATIVVKGGELPEDIQESFDRYMVDLLARAKSVRAERRAAAKEKAQESAGPVLTVQDRMRMQAEEVCAEFDTWLDELLLGNTKTIPAYMDPASKMKAAHFKAGQARWVKLFYENELVEIKQVLAGDDKDLKEGWSNIQKSSLVRAEKLLDKIITSADVIGTVSNAKRKTRKRKAPSIEKQIAKLNYCESAPEYGVGSVSPTGIVGAKEVWVFNTKYRKLGKYIALDESGLSVKGTTIQNFATASVQKTLRKPKQQLKEFMNAGKVKLRTFLDDIKAVDTKMNGRINDNIVILKIFK